MNSWKTTLCGALAALSLAGFADLGLPSPWPRLLALTCAVALAALGYHATDCTTCPGNKLRLAALLLVVFVVVAVTGCTLSRFSLAVSNPAFGRLAVGIGGGSIGKGQTNAADLIAADLAESETNRTAERSVKQSLETKAPPVPVGAFSDPGRGSNTPADVKQTSGRVSSSGG